MKIIIFYLLFLVSFMKPAFGEENVQTDRIYIITKDIDVTKLAGEYYEIASNASAKILPGLGCRCTKYTFPEINLPHISYFNVNFHCQRNFLFSEQNSNLTFRFVLTQPFNENSTVVKEFTVHVYLMEGTKQIFVNDNLSIIYAETDESDKFKHIIFGGTSPLQPMIIISKQRFISKEDFNKLLNALYTAGYDPKLLNWPFLLSCDQTFCN